MDQGECDEDTEDEGDLAGSNGMEDGDLGQLPEFRDSDDDELIALGGALDRASPGRREMLDLDDSRHLLENLQEAVDSNRRDNKNRKNYNEVMIDLSNDDFSGEIGGGHATNLDGLDKD